MSAYNRLALDGGRPQLASSDITSWPQFTSDDDIAVLRAARGVDGSGTTRPPCAEVAQQPDDAQPVDTGTATQRPASPDPGSSARAGLVGGHRANRRDRLLVRRGGRTAPHRWTRTRIRRRSDRPRRSTARPSDGLDGRGSRVRRCGSSDAPHRPPRRRGRVGPQHQGRDGGRPVRHHRRLPRPRTGHRQRRRRLDRGRIVVDRRHVRAAPGRRARHDEHLRSPEPCHRSGSRNRGALRNRRLRSGRKRAAATAGP